MTRSGDGHETVSRRARRVNGGEDRTACDRLVSMSGKAKQSHGAHYEIGDQSGEWINNVGGNQYFGDKPRRSASLGRALAALGLALFFAGVFTLGAAALQVYEKTNGFADTGSVVVPAYAIPAGMLVVAGIVLNRFGRLYAGK
jgi:hypothetical protein